MKAAVVMMFIAMLCTACATPSTSSERTLTAPANSVPAAVSAIEEGNRQFAGRHWEAARTHYEEAIKVQPTLAEAHYNLGLVYDMLRDDATAKRHFIEAANLAPGNKVIWDAPPLKRHGDVDAHPKGNDAIFLPAVR